jgi:elongation factor G
MSSPVARSANPNSGAAQIDLHHIRTLALVGPAAAGKTTLAEALLQQAGVIGAVGSVEKGSTVSDYDPIERRMQHSLHSSVMHLNHGSTRIHLLDTPGNADFLGQSLPALEAVETAAIVINATTGIEPMAVRMMAYAAERQLDRMIIVNRIDAPGVKPADLLAQIQATFGRECLPLNLPASGGAEVVDCWFAPAAQPGHEADFSSVAAAHRALVEQVVEVDGEFVDRYLNEGDVPATELHAPLEQALREGHLIPVFFVSAKTGVGVAQLLDVVTQLLPDPTEGNLPDFYKGEGAQAQLMHAQVDAAQHVLAHVFKVAVDPYVGKMGVFRIHQGTVSKDSLLYVGDGRKPFKVGHLFMLQGKDHVEVLSALPGDIVAVAKVDEIAYDAVLHDAAEDDHIHLKPLPFPVPVHGLALKPKRHGDDQRLAEVLAKLAAEDPCLKVEQVAATHETVVYGLGELHLRVVLERLRETYRVEVDTAPPRIAYRETITGNCAGAVPPQEADRRCRPVRRGAPADRAAAAGRGLRVRGRGQGRHDSRPVHTGGGKGRAPGHGSRCHRRPPGGGPARDRARRQAPQRGQQGDRLRHRRQEGLHRGHEGSQPHRAGAGGGCGDHRHRGLDRRHHRRSGFSSRRGAGHRCTGRRAGFGAGAGAAV